MNDNKYMVDGVFDSEREKRDMLEFCQRQLKKENHEQKWKDAEVIDDIKRIVKQLTESGNYYIDSTKYCGGITNSDFYKLYRDFGGNYKNPKLGRAFSYFKAYKFCDEWNRRYAICHKKDRKGYPSTNLFINKKEEGPALAPVAPPPKKKQRRNRTTKDEVDSLRSEMNQLKQVIDKQQKQIDAIISKFEM